MNFAARLLCVLFACNVFGHELALAEQSGDQAWRSIDTPRHGYAEASISATNQPSVVLTIAFPPDRRCYTADMFLKDGDGHALSLGHARLTVGRDQFTLSPLSPATPGVYELSPTVFHALKRSRSMRLETGAGDYAFSLSASAAAINTAWQACDEYLKKEKASGVESQAVTDRFTQPIK